MQKQAVHAVRDSPEMSAMKAELSNYNGTEDYHKDGFSLYFTDGVRAMAELAGAYWLITDISVVVHTRFPRVPFQVWTLTVNPDKTAILQMIEDTGCPVRYEQLYPYTDFPVGQFEMWVESGVIILPSEH